MSSQFFFIFFINRLSIQKVFWFFSFLVLALSLFCVLSNCSYHSSFWFFHLFVLNFLRFTFRLVLFLLLFFIVCFYLILSLFFLFSWICFFFNILFSWKSFWYYCLVNFKSHVLVLPHPSFEWLAENLPSLFRAWEERPQYVVPLLLLFLVFYWAYSC